MHWSMSLTFIDFLSPDINLILDTIFGFDLLMRELRGREVKRFAQYHRARMETWAKWLQSWSYWPVYHAISPIAESPMGLQRAHALVIF